LATRVNLLCRHALENIVTTECASLPSGLGDRFSCFRPLTPELALTVYRLAQASSTSMAKYASAAAVEICLQVRCGPPHVRVQDDGCGQGPLNAQRRHHGPAGMCYRIQSPGGSLFVRFSPGHGTLIELHMPMRDATAPLVKPEAEGAQDVTYGANDSNRAQHFAAMSTK